MKMSFSRIVASAEPPRTVKSSPVTAMCLPSILALPITALAGVSSTRSFLPSYCALPETLPISRKEPLSTSRSMRSRTVSRPPSCWRFTLSAPPIRRFISWRRRSSSISGCQLMGRSPDSLVSNVVPALVSYQPGREGATLKALRAGSLADGRNRRQQRSPGRALPDGRPLPVVGYRPGERLRRDDGVHAPCRRDRPLAADRHRHRGGRRAAADRGLQGALHLPRSGRLLRRDGAAVPRQLRRQGADVPLPQERRHRRRPARALRLGTGPPVVRWDKRGVTLLLPIQMGRCPEGAEGSLAAASVEATIHLLAAKRFVDRLHDLLRPREDVAVPEP